MRGLWLLFAQAVTVAVAVALVYRVFGPEPASPAPTNLVIPPHQYLSETRLVVGLDEKA